MRNALNEVLEGIQCGLNALFAGFCSRLIVGVAPSSCASLAGLIWNPMTDKPQEGLPDHCGRCLQVRQPATIPAPGGRGVWEGLVATVQEAGAHDFKATLTSST